MPEAASNGYNVRYATFIERAGAWIIDSLIIWIGLSLFGNIFNPRPEQTFFGVMYSMEGSLMQIVLVFLYCVLQESSVHQATIGKRVFNLRVTDLPGNRLSFRRASVRHLSKFLSWIILLAGFFMMLWSTKRQALHDRIAGTLVLKG
jgi:uncharacterized RDD family membrane protein YckC